MMKFIDLVFCIGWAILAIASFAGFLIPTPFSYGLACVCIALAELKNFMNDE